MPNTRKFAMAAGVAAIAIAFVVNIVLIVLLARTGRLHPTSVIMLTSFIPAIVVIGVNWRRAATGKKGC